MIRLYYISKLHDTRQGSRSIKYKLTGICAKRNRVSITPLRSLLFIVVRISDDPRVLAIKTVFAWRDSRYHERGSAWAAMQRVFMILTGH